MELLNAVSAAGVPGILAMILGLMFLILVHEFGHWIVARMFGFKTPVFSIGFGKREWSLVLGTYWDTEFRISPILLGGYVSIPELQDETTAKEMMKGTEDAQNVKVFPVWQRQLVAVAGVVMNILTAFAIFASLLFFIGQPSADITATKVRALSPEVTIAQDAGIEAGDKFVTVDGVKIVTPDDLVSTFQSNKNTPVEVVVDRDGETKEFTVTPNADGIIGIGIDIDYNEVYTKKSFGESVTMGAKQTYTQFVGMIKGLGMMVGLVDLPPNTPDGAADVHGVVGIVQIGASAFDQGTFQFLSIVALISLNLALLNILPIPMLDGGHMMFYTIESIRGKPVSLETRQKASSIFFFLLLALMFYGLFNDITKPVQLP